MHLPLELFYQFALHLPSTKDVLAFALTHSGVRRALLTPALFKERLALRWDLSAWRDAEEDSAAAAESPLRYLERWMRIDYIHCRTVQLLDEATVANYFTKRPPQGPVSKQLDPKPPDIATPASDQGPVPSKPSLDEQKAIVWLQKLSEVLPGVLTHNRGANVLQITQTKYHGVLLTLATALASICSVLKPKRSFARFSGRQILKPMPPTSECTWLERICFCLVALLIQCDTDTVKSIVSDTMAYSVSPSSAFWCFWATNNVEGYPMDSDPYVFTVPMIEAVKFRSSDRYLSTFMIQGKIFMALVSNTSLPLCPPSIPHIDPAASISYDELFGPQQVTSPSSSSSPPLRPWLQNRLAGTPLAALLLSADDGESRHLWAGYYTIDDDETNQDPPMFLELQHIPGPLALLPIIAQDPSDTVYFRGEGHDRVGTFTLKGVCDISAGTVTARKSYATHGWNWHGMVSPFGMAGRWGEDFLTAGGWWWIWPREWSNKPAATETN